MATQKIIRGQPSWVIATPQVEAAVTQQGGHLAPVRFLIGKDRWVAPFAIAPWTSEKLPPGTPPVMQVMRGDFFCMPFGGNETPYRGECYPSHGETANAVWTLEKGTPYALALSMRTQIRKGRVDKEIRLVPGHSAIYSSHTISGMKGPMSFGHHPILRVPEGTEARVSTSPFVHGEVFPGAFENPALGGYSCLKPGGKFTSLQRVPQADGLFADLSTYPSREGFEDLVMMAANDALPFSWTAMVVPGEGYVWFSLKNPRVLRSTVFWISNGGRHYSPWNGRHRRVIGLEEVTSNFHYGLAESARSNALSRAGIRTSVVLDPAKPLVVNFIMAVAAVPGGFDIVRSISAAADEQSVTLVSRSGGKITVPLNVGFVTG
ncbi:MAG: hypothetical protein ACFUZC_07940 [Chthoniobacteraceae bacterium]